MNPIDAIAQHLGEYTAWRRDLHAHPELGFEESRTSALVAERLEAMGIEVHRGLGGTGVVGVIRGKGRGNAPRSIGLRADMDALPLSETNGFGHASTTPGKMHGCGHDGHTTMLLAAARYLAETRNFDGTVHLLFQPAEELGSGAPAMQKDGLFERFPCDAVYALHNKPGMPVGHYGINPGPMLAGVAFFDIHIQGKGGHAARPEVTQDPVVAGAALVGLIGGRLRPAQFAFAGHAARAAALVDDDAAPLPHTRFQVSHTVKVALVGAALWGGPMARLVALTGWHSAYSQMARFFTKAALMTFGGAYAVLPYVYQGAVEHYGWITPSMMIDGLALG
jgi:acetylornithine deacetylase/succinyl-diaminopimelate desuccinylase-like protein